MVIQKDLGNEVELLQFNSKEPSITEGFSTRMAKQTAFNRLSWISQKGVSLGWDTPKNLNNIKNAF